MRTPVLDYTLLGLLASRDQHGYQLLAEFRGSGELAQVWRIGISQLYAVLKRLETTGAVRPQYVPRPDAPERTVYAITDAGQAQLTAWLEESAPSASVRQVRVEFLSRLAIARRLGCPTERLIAAQHAACQRELSRLNEQIAAEEGIPKLALELQAGQQAALLEWIEQSVQPAGDTP